MSRRWSLVAAVIAGLGMSQVVFASSQYIYRSDPAAKTPSFHQFGQNNSSAEGIRILSSLAAAGDLSAAERKSVQLNIHYHSLFVPNDPQYSLQWDLQTMHVPTAWDIDQTPPLYGGDPKIVVAVLDTGVAMTETGSAQSVPDLSSSSIWKNTAEIPGDGIDNDHDGYIDDVHGWNFINSTPRPADDNGHGTHIANIIAAGLNNGIAAAGIASNVTIMPLKVLDTNGDGTTVSLTAAVDYAVAHGANIINLSLGGDNDDTIFHQAIQNAVAHGVVVIGAAGNSGVGTVTYPASYPEVISVGAVQYDETLAPYSNYGSRLDLVAPGGNMDVDQNHDGQPDGILAQTWTDKTLTSFSAMFYVGTSQAAAHVSAVAALLESCGIAGNSIKAVLTSTADDLGVVGPDPRFGYGEVDAALAMHVACQSTAPSPVSAIHTFSSTLSTVALQNNWNQPYTHPQFTWQGDAGVISYAITWSKDTTVVTTVNQTGSSYVPTITSPGNYTLSVSAIDVLGRVSIASTTAYRYQPPTILHSSGSTIQLVSPKLVMTKTLNLSSTTVITNIMGGVLVAGQRNYVLLSQANAGSWLSLADTSGRIVKKFLPFGLSYAGGINAVTVPQTDGTSLIVAAMASSGASIAWYTADGRKLGTNLPFAHYHGGVHVAVGDVNGDGQAELIVSEVTGPSIAIYSTQRQRLASFQPRGATFTQGWNIAVGDIDGDGTAEILATPNISASTHKILVLSGTGHEIRSLKVSGFSTSSAIDLQVIDLTGDGKVELLTSLQHGATNIRSWSPTGTLLQRLTVSGTTMQSLGILLN